MNTIDLEKDIRNRLGELIEPKFIDSWLNSPNGAFEGKKPIDLINEGKIIFPENLYWSPNES